MKKSYVFVGILLLAVGAFAQSPSLEENGRVVGGPVVIAAGQSAPQGEKDQNFTYIERLPSSVDPLKPDDMRFFTVMVDSSNVVKNAPYTASAVSVTTQTLGDGIRIINKSTGSLARDGEGRTRREENVVRIGSLQGEGPKIVTINDPVAHAEYVFQPGEPNGQGGFALHSGEGMGIGMGSSNGAVKPKVRTFHMSKTESGNSIEFGTTNDRGTKTYVTTLGDQEGTDAKKESLGTQTMEGVTAEGTRVTKTIPASSDLQTVVLSKRNDPRFGETVYKLTGITRGEPDPALFQPPSNIKRININGGQAKY